MQRTMDLIRMRGVKYWPAPFLPSAAAFSKRPSYAAALMSVRDQRLPRLRVERIERLDDVLAQVAALRTRARVDSRALGQGAKVHAVEVFSHQRR